MVDVGMRDEKKFYFIRLVNINFPVPFFDLCVPLVHAAIDGEPMALGLQDETGSRHRPCCPHKLYFHIQDS
jgi:hypothetical protein